MYLICELGLLCPNAPSGATNGYDHSPGLPVAPLYYKLNDRTVLISYIIYDEGKSL